MAVRKRCQKQLLSLVVRGGTQCLFVLRSFFLSKEKKASMSENEHLQFQWQWSIHSSNHVSFLPASFFLGYLYTWQVTLWTGRQVHHRPKTHHDMSTHKYCSIESERFSVNQGAFTCISWWKRTKCFEITPSMYAQVYINTFRTRLKKWIWFPELVLS